MLTIINELEKILRDENWADHYWLIHQQFNALHRDVHDTAVRHRAAIREMSSSG